MPKEGTAPSARRIASRLADEMGYEFIDAELQKEHGSVFLRIFINHPDGLDLSRCEAYHRRLNPLVEHLSYDYLEVSSPGIDRPLKTERDFAGNLGRGVEIKLYKVRDGKKVYTGVLEGLEGDEILLAHGGATLRFARKDCALVRPSVDGAFARSDEEENP